MTRVTRLLLVISMLLFMLFPFSSNASSMQKLAEEDLDSITAGSFSRFTFETDIEGVSRATVDLNINAEMYATVDNFRAHYRPAPRDGGLADSEWDQDWRDVTLGESVESPLKLEHFVFEAAFENFETNEKRLLSVKMGFETVNGTMTIDELLSFTGTYGGENFFRLNPSEIPDPEPGAEFIFTDDPMYIIFDSKGWIGADVPEPPNYNRGNHPETSFQNQPLVRFDFGDAVRNQFTPTP